MKTNRKTYFFCGIGGSGMSSIAQVLNHNGHEILGSDRNFDQNKGLAARDLLLSLGIKLFPQNGSGLCSTIDELIVSTAVEDSIPDVQQAKLKNIPIVKRAQILAEIFNESSCGIAVGGTSGKSTVTGMIGHILMHSGKNPTVINGAEMLNSNSSEYSGSVYCNDGDLTVIEADESDGTIEYYRPDIGVITNISLDHKSLDELNELFKNFSKNSTNATVLNFDCPESRKLLKLNQNFTSFSVKNYEADIVAESIKFNDSSIEFNVKEHAFTLNLTGDFNLENALAAIAACSTYGISLSDCAKALTTFSGIKRRLQNLGCVNGVTVIDDFAHNPEKIAATLKTLKRFQKRLLVMFQPHGYAPAHLAKDGLIKAFSNTLDGNDFLVMPNIFYSGGTADKKISSTELINAIKSKGINAEHISDRNQIENCFLSQVDSGDIIVIMGARDDTLTDFATSILRKL